MRSRFNAYIGVLALYLLLVAMATPSAPAQAQEEQGEYEPNELVLKLFSASDLAAVAAQYQLTPASTAATRPWPAGCCPASTGGGSTTTRARWARTASTTATATAPTSPAWWPSSRPTADAPAPPCWRGRRPVFAPGAYGSARSR